MRKLYGLLGLFVAVGLVVAATSQIKEYRSRDDFAPGDSKGVSIHADGMLTLAPATQKIFDATTPQVWRLTSSGGTIYAGAGSPASIFRIGDKGDTTRIFQNNAVAVFALCDDGDNGLWFAPSPGGDIYHFSNGAVQKVATLQVTYVWDMLRDGKDVLIASGSPGMIYRLSANGTLTPFFKSNETHIRTLALDANKMLYAGSADNGLVFRFDKSGKPFVVYDSPQTEIFAVIPLANGDIWAAGASDGLQRPGPSTGAMMVSDITIEDDDQDVDAEKGATVTPVVVAPGRQTKNQSAVYKISATGRAKDYWEKESSRVHAIYLMPDNSLLIGTGDAAKVFQLTSAGEINQLLDLESSQLTHFLAVGKDIYVATANVGGCYVIKNELTSQGEYLSPVFDANLLAHWGNLSSVSEGNVSFFVRTGNSEKPDVTWSDWGSPLKSGVITAPAARFLQWRAVLEREGNNDPKIRSVLFGYIQQNVAPEISDIQVYDPGEAFPDAVEDGKKNQSLEDGEQGPAKNRQRLPRSSKKVQKKGYQSIGWNAVDGNDDALMFDLFYRSADSQAWRPLVTDYASTIYSWDSQTMADGEYVVKIVATDEKDNAWGQQFKAEMVTPVFVIDNTPPVISGLRLVRESTRQVVFTVKDARNRLSEAYFALDAGEWRSLLPADGIADSLAEAYAIALDQGGAAGLHTITVKVSDKNGNISMASLNFTL